MTWVLRNGDSSREFPTREEAEDAKADLAGLGGDLSIEEKETETTDSDDIDADYIEMPYDDGSEAETNNDDNGGCPRCGRVPNCVYRCECGRDLAGIRTGVGTGGRP